MNYIGSKNKLSSFIKQSIIDVVGERKMYSKTFCDIFAGTGIIGRVFKKEVKKVIANDFEYYSYVLLLNYIGNSAVIQNSQIYLRQLNELPPQEGFIYNNYCLGSGSERQYFSDDNGRKIDAVRMQIEAWNRSGKINASLYFFLLASLLESADKVANTASVYGAFLKHLKDSAKKPLVIKAAEFELTGQENWVFQQDSNVLIKKIKGDILYLDPPYNARQYGANYHMLNTIALYDDFLPKGKTGLREYEKSLYCSKSKVLSSFRELIHHAQFRYIFLSYNNEGLMTLEEIQEILKEYGRYDRMETDYQRFKADRDVNRTHKATSTVEYLHILEKIP